VIEELERVSIRSSDPILLTGPTGAGKSQLAQRIYSLKKQKGLIGGKLVIVNCATLKGENAMSALFGHKKGAFTGATTDRPGLLREANSGLLFLDEIGELGTDEQAMLLRAIEDKKFMPFGADKESSSDFLLIAGTNRDLNSKTQQGEFREDLLARIDLWTYRLPSLSERMEDFEPNLDFEIENFSKKAGFKLSINSDARKKYLSFAKSTEGKWSANFRDLNASISRMGTLSDGGRITVNVVNKEIERLQTKWQITGNHPPSDDLNYIESILGEEKFKSIDLYEQISLAPLLRICRDSKSMADAGRRLFNISRSKKSSSNDSHRVKQILDKYGITFRDLN